MTHSIHKKAKVTLIYNKIKESLIHLFIYLANMPIDRSNFVNYKFTIFSFMQFYTVLLAKIYLKIPLLSLLFTLLLFFIIFLLVELNYKFTKGLVKIKFTIYIKYNLLTLFVLFLDLQYSFNLSMISIISSDAFIESFTRRGCRVFLSEVILGVFLRYRRNKGSSFIFGCFVLFYFSWVFYFYNLLFLFQEIFFIFLFYFSLFITSSHRSILSPILSVIVNTSFLMYFFTGLDLFSYGVLVIVNDDL